VLTAPPNLANGSPLAAFGVGSTPNSEGLGAAAIDTADDEAEAIIVGIALIEKPAFCAGAAFGTAGRAEALEARATACRVEQPREGAESHPHNRQANDRQQAEVSIPTQTQHVKEGITHAYRLLVQMRHRSRSLEF
jgi:hypothetical protein